MSEELIVRHCAPTLAGLKTGSLFLCPIESRSVFLEEIRDLNRFLVPKGLRALPLRIHEKKALIYLYRPSKLENDLSQPSAAEILRSMGYPENGQLSSLVRKFRTEEEFPHEVGLFLGYPPEDVQGFLDNRPCKCVGCWKVYGDVDSARKKFSLYKKCARVYCDRLAKGTDMNRLIVAG